MHIWMVGQHLPSSMEEKVSKVWLNPKAVLAPGGERGSGQTVSWGLLFPHLGARHPGPPSSQPLPPTTTSCPDGSRCPRHGRRGGEVCRRGPSHSLGCGQVTVEAGVSAWGITGPSTWPFPASSEGEEGGRRRDSPREPWATIWTRHCSNALS